MNVARFFIRAVSTCGFPAYPEFSSIAEFDAAFKRRGVTSSLSGEMTLANAHVTPPAHPAIPVADQTVHFYNTLIRNIFLFFDYFLLLLFSQLKILPLKNVKFVVVTIPQIASVIYPGSILLHFFLFNPGDYKKASICVLLPFEF
ncbi:MAG: hypothetical protein NTV99_06075, partial [Deltaproteobacteria bacterium]|nr:hypothetical protein [Deltaproteobacteria bacterium]